MVNIHPQFITDKTGKKIFAILPMKEFKAIIEKLEETDNTKSYDEARKASLPADVVFKMIDDILKKTGKGYKAR